MISYTDTVKLAVKACHSITQKHLGCATLCKNYYWYNPTVLLKSVTVLELQLKLIKEGVPRGVRKRLREHYYQVLTDDRLSPEIFVEGQGLNLF